MSIIRAPSVAAIRPSQTAASVLAPRFGSACSYGVATATPTEVVPPMLVARSDSLAVLHRAGAFSWLTLLGR
jgi:hypothetical protein